MTTYRANKPGVQALTYIGWFIFWLGFWIWFISRMVA